MLEVFSPELLQGTHHPELGALYDNNQISLMFGCKDSSTIRSQKSRLAKKGEISEGKHWLLMEAEGKGDKVTFWTFEGMCQLGLNLSTGPAAQFRSAIVEMLKAWQSGELAFLPTETGGIDIQPKGGALRAATAAPLELPDPVAVGEAIALHQYETEIEAWKDSVAAVVEGASRDLRSGVNSTLGKYLGSVYGVNPL